MFSVYCLFYCLLCNYYFAKYIHSLMVFLMFIAYLSISYSYVANIDLFFQYSFI